MSKLTGPGKVQDLPRGGPGRVRRKGLLFNYDIEGEKLKPEHERWLEANVMPLLGSPLMSVRIRGLASRSGSAAYNQGLSDRRVKGVRDFLVRKGAKLSQVTGVGVGEDDASLAGQIDGNEDEKFRGVVVTAVTLLRTAQPAFEQVFPHQKENGFDATAVPRWLMVPMQNPLREIRIVNAAGLQIVSRNRSIAEPVSFTRSQPLDRITSDDEVIRVLGKMAGKTRLEVLDVDGSIVVALAVSVLTKITVKSAFHFVKHPTIGTTRRLGAEREMLRVMNSIYLPQVNVEFSHHQARELPITGAFGNEVNEAGTLPNGDREWDTIVANRNTGARFNVFFVKELEQAAAEADGTDDADALATIAGLDCIFEDDAGVEEGESLAHEAGHCLGVRHNSPITSTVDMLMWDTTDQRERFIPKIHVEKMRTTLGQP